MENNNLNPAQDEQKPIIIIDIEEHFKANKPHHDHDPGVIVHYKIRVDGEYYEVKHRRPSGRDILSLTEKDAQHYRLAQSKKVGADIKLVHIAMDELVDLGEYGIEHFKTMPHHKDYVFFIGKKDYKTEHSHLTVKEILTQYAGVDPKNKTLAKDVPGGGFVEYKNIDESISLEGCPHFTLFDNDPTTKS